MNNWYRSAFGPAAIVGCLVSAISTPTTAVESESLTNALRDGAVSLSFRYRLEQVDQEGFGKDALASTLRSRLAYESSELENFSIAAEIDNILVLGGDTYNSTRNGKTDRPVVADPKGTDVNQAYLRYMGLEGADIRYGRHRINLDNQRFIGAVGWRQNEQTFDGLRAYWRGLADTVLEYAYLYNVNRVFGPDDGTPPANLDSASHILNARYTGWSPAVITGYAYFLEFDDAQALSTSTVGARITGDTRLNEKIDLIYGAELAHQSDYADNPARYSANYYLLEGGVKIEPFTVKLSIEVLEGSMGSPGERFTTPLATLHPFQGWADQFLVTPDAGIEDRYVSLGAKVMGANVLLVIHDFDAEAGGQNLGEEVDFIITKRFSERYAAALKYASYDASGFSVDTDKFWLMFSADF